MSKVPAFLDFNRVGDDRLKPQDTLVELAGFVEVERRETDVGKSFVIHFYYSSCLDSDDRGDTCALASGPFCRFCGHWLLALSS